MKKKKIKISEHNQAQLTYRHGWEINPKTRIVPSKKVYKRGRVKQQIKKELDNA